jgi:hypothetical protein
MDRKKCKTCGSKIPSKSPITGKYTPKNRQRCYNCAPTQQKQNNKEERRRRKEELVKMLGGSCVECGYNKSIRALSFHHINPEEKEFDISANGFLLKDWSMVVAEAKKCCLLCLNCHAEFHNDKKLHPELH